MISDLSLAHSHTWDEAWGQQFHEWECAQVFKESA